MAKCGNCGGENYCFTDGELCPNCFEEDDVLSRISKSLVGQEEVEVFKKFRKKTEDN